MNVNLTRSVFSVYGSYLSLNPSLWNAPLGKGLYLCTHTGRGRKAPRELFLLEPILDGKGVDAEISCSPSLLRFSVDGAQADVTFEGECGLRIRSSRLSVRLRAVPDARVLLEPRPSGHWVAHAARCETKFLLHAVRGTLHVTAPWRISEGRNRGIQYNEGGIELAPHSELRLVECDTAPRVHPVESFEHLESAWAADWQRWIGSRPAPSVAGWEKGQQEAAYITWCSVVAPRGQQPHAVMMMNKTCMDQVWSWDHCFNAMACCQTAPELAWDQFMSIADFQDVNGCLPDSVNHHMTQFTFTKPPIHGWAYAWCWDRNPDFFGAPERLAVSYEWMSQWSQWWLNECCTEGSQLPRYLHGNNSGWDNATIFDVACPTLSPDGPAYLALQCEVLGRMANELGRAEEATQWRLRSQDIQKELIDTLWRGDHFVGLTPEGKDIECESLITCMPMVLGSRLPKEIQEALAARIDTFLTPYGLATEHPDSPEFHQHSHAYWRSSVWPPPVMLAVTGLWDAGDHERANRIIEAYCNATAACGFRENHDPLTGEGRSDYAFTWTASVSLMLAEKSS